MARPPAAGVACPLTGAGRDRPMEHTGGGDAPLGPVDPLVVPRFAGPATFARLPRLDQVDRCDVAVVGVPFDGGTTYRPGARFGPAAIRAGSRLLRGYHAGLEVRPFADQQVADAGDIACTPFAIDEAIAQIEAGTRLLLADAAIPVVLGGDHTVALPVLRAVHERHGPRRADPLRCPPRYVGHVLRRALHARHPVPPRARGGAPRERSMRAPRDPRPAVHARGPGRTTPGSGSRSSARSTTCGGRSTRSPTRCASGWATYRSTCRSTST